MAVHYPHPSAFSLIELSIVLVILGLLTGGILAGQSLIRAAELRKYQTNFTKYETAVLSFRDKYMALPGDMPNAESFWNRLTALCPANANPTAANGVCNGNGDGQVTFSVVREIGNVFPMLARAGLIEGSYVYIDVPGNGDAQMLGVTYPPGPENTAYQIRYLDYYGRSLNYLHVGAVSTGTTGYGKGTLKVDEAWNIDTKMDDGIASTGKLLGAREWTAAPTTSAQRCTSQSASVASPISTYNLSTAIELCTMSYVLP